MELENKVFAASGVSDELLALRDELAAVRARLDEREREIEELNQELDDTNRGVMALYAELDEQAEYLKRVSELKSSFLSNMSHEFRTPLSSIVSLTRFLLDRMDGDLTEEQEKQVALIRSSALTLSELVDDLLDLAKIEAGMTSVRPAPFLLPDLFASLRGVFRPIASHGAAEMIFDDPADLPELFTDEGKVAQIVRNLVSNALKFTPAGEIRISAATIDAATVSITVADTGVGIDPAYHERIFDEFVQVAETPIKARGTGLGLPLSRKLARLLGGDLTVESELERGSRFILTLPTRYVDNCG